MHQLFHVLLARICRHLWLKDANVVCNRSWLHGGMPVWKLNLLWLRILDPASVSYRVLWHTGATSEVGRRQRTVIVHMAILDRSVVICIGWLANFSYCWSLWDKAVIALVGISAHDRSLLAPALVLWTQPIFHIDVWDHIQNVLYHGQVVIVFELFLRFSESLLLGLNGMLWLWAENTRAEWILRLTHGCLLIEAFILRMDWGDRHAMLRLLLYKRIG